MKIASTNNIALAILLGSFVIAIALLMRPFIQPVNNDNPSGNPEKIYENITYIKTDGSPFLGSPDAPVTVIEYIDFQCPFCKKVYDESIPRLRKEFIDTAKIKFVFKNMPISGLHPAALTRSHAAFCAFELGGNSAFFKYHDAIFYNFTTLPNNSDTTGLSNIATLIGLDANKFSKCLSAPINPIIEKDRIESLLIGARGTPTWLIGKTKGDKLTDTVKISGVHPYEVYKTVIDQLLTN